MPPCRRLIFAALIATAGPAWAEAPARLSFVTMELFWKVCDARGAPPALRAGSWCYGYVMGNIDATIAIGAALHRSPLCLTADGPDAIVERIISFMPSKIRTNESAGGYVQAAILRAMRCD